MIHSHYTLNTWEICPRQYYHKIVLKDLLREAKSQAQTWGIQVHSAMEARINKGTPLPKKMEKWEPLVNFGPYVTKAEVKLGMRENGLPCGFFDSDCWLRGVVDVHISHPDGLATAAIADWKTGKRREDPEELAIHAVLLKAHFSHYEKITGFYVWLQDSAVGQPHDLSATDQKRESLRETIDEIGHQSAMGYFPPKQNPLCSWCKVTCEYNPDPNLRPK